MLPSAQLVESQLQWCRPGFNPDWKILKRESTPGTFSILFGEFYDLRTHGSRKSWT